MNGKRMWTGYNWVDVVIRITVVSALFYGGIVLKDFFAVDACLDAGNSFNYETNQCDE